MKNVIHTQMIIVNSSPKYQLFEFAGLKGYCTQEELADVMNRRLQNEQNMESENKQDDISI